MKRVILFAAILAPSFPLAAAAQVTPEHAASLQTQIRDWFQSTLGAGGKSERDPVTVTAAGDHFDVTAPLSLQPGAPRMTGKMMDAGNGRWAVDDIAIPSPSVFHVTLPASTKSGPTRDATITMTIGSQQQSMLIDPTFATPSTLTAKLGDLALTNQFGGPAQLSHIDSGTSATTITPVADGQADIVSATTLTGYSMKVTGGADEPAVSVMFGKTAMTAAFTDVSRERAAQISHVLSQLGQFEKTIKASPAAPAIPRETALALMTALTDLAKSGRIDQTIDDVTVSGQGLTGSLKQFSVGLDSKVDNGKLQAQLPLSANGLTLPDLNLGGLTTLIPTMISLTPKVSSVPTEALMRLSNRLVDDQDPDQQDIQALFRKGPINASIDDFHLDVAGASFAGHLAMAFTSPSAFSGTGQITADNIDKLQQAVAAEPQSAQMAPLLIFMKGIGRVEQNRLVWDIVYRNGRVEVNGQDMAALTGGPAPTQPAAPKRKGPAPRPSPTRP